MSNSAAAGASTAVAAGARPASRVDWNLHTALMVRVISYLPVMDMLLSARRVCTHWSRLVPVASAVACTRFNFGQFWASLGVVPEYVPQWSRLVRHLGFYQVRSLSFAFCDHLGDELFISLLRLFAPATSLHPPLTTGAASPALLPDGTSAFVTTTIQATATALNAVRSLSAAGAAAPVSAAPNPVSAVPHLTLADLARAHRFELYAKTPALLARLLSTASKGGGGELLNAAAASAAASAAAPAGSLVTTLDLYYCYLLTDAAVAEVCALFPNLEVLSLGRCFALTDRAIRSCAKLKHLKHLNLVPPSPSPSSSSSSSSSSTTVSAPRPVLCFGFSRFLIHLLCVCCAPVRYHRIASRFATASGNVPITQVSRHSVLHAVRQVLAASLPSSSSPPLFLTIRRCACALCCVQQTCGGDASHHKHHDCRAGRDSGQNNLHPP
jgi:hypothetical protein